MSIINDALKKAEENKQFSQPKTIEILKVGKGLYRDKKIHRRLIGALAVFCLLSIIAVNFLLSAPSTSSKKYSLGLPQRILQMRKIDIEPNTQTGNFQLSGILFEKENPLAIINKQIVAVGALINGARILEISPTYVKLSYRDNELMLKIR